MGFCGAFFGDLNDWIHQDHHFSFEPSGISKTKVLFQVVNIFQVADNVYLPLADGQNDFLIKTFEDVETASELLERLKKENIERIRGVDIEKVLSTLKEKKPEIPFFCIEPSKSELANQDTNSRPVVDIFKNGPVDISVLLVTKTHDCEKKEIKHVVTNGSQAKYFLLFVHPKKQPTDSSPLKLFSKKEYQEGNQQKEDCEWFVNPNPAFGMCLRGAKCILFHTPGAEGFKTDGNDWQLMLANLLKKCDEEIEGDKKTAKNRSIRAIMSTRYQEGTYGDHWKRIKEYFKSYFEDNSESIKSPERPIFLISSDKSRSYGDNNLESIFCQHTKVRDLLAPGNDPRVICEHCLVEFYLSELLAHSLKRHRKKVYESSTCPVCKHCPPSRCSYQNKGTLKSHFSGSHNPSKKTGQKRKTKESSSPGCSKAKRTK